MNSPNLKKRIYKKEYAQELLKIAAGDLDSSLELSQAKTGRPENIIFLVQQSVFSSGRTNTSKIEMFRSRVNSKFTFKYLSQLMPFSKSSKGLMTHCSARL
jgi:hypothetical protein